MCIIKNYVKILFDVRTWKIDTYAWEKDALILVPENAVIQLTCYLVCGPQL